MTDDKPKRQHRRGRGEGSISKVPGREMWRARLTIGRDPNGRQIRTTVYGKTKKEVTDKLTRLQSKKLDGKLIASGRLTVDNLLSRWLMFWAENIADTTRREYQRLSDLYIRPHLGEIDVAKLTRLNVQTLMDSLAAKGVGGRTRQYVFQTLRCAINAAIERELCAVNPCRKSMNPKRKPKEATAITNEQAAALVNAARGGEWEALIVLALGSGMRQGELFALAWEDVDLTARTIHVRHSLQEVNGELKIKSPKSESGLRVIALDSRTVEALENHRRLTIDAGKSASRWVFSDSRGGLLRKSNFARKEWYPIREAAGLDSLRFHDLRHTHITWLIDDNVPLKEVQGRVGHSTPQMVMRYAHRTKHSQDRAQSAMESRMSATNPSNPYVTLNRENGEKIEQP